MALGAVLAAALTDHSAHRASLWINGLDVLRQPGAPGNLYGTPIDSIVIQEQGPGGVSGMTFTILDPQAAITPRGGDVVVLWDHQADVPLFAGWIYPTVAPKALGTGRLWRVRAIGAEAILDWSYTPAGTYGGDAATVVQGMVGATTFGAPGIRAFANAFPYRSSQAGPIGDWINGAMIYTWSGGTLRAALRGAADFLSAQGLLAGLTPWVVRFTVDWYLGLRAWPEDAVLGPVPTDYVDLTVTDTYAGALVATDLDHVTDYSDARRTVYVKGSTAAATGPVSDGSGIPGPVTVISPSGATTADDRMAYAGAELVSHGVSNRGTFGLDDVTVSPGVHAGGRLILTDAQLGATGTYVIGGITRTFNPSGRVHLDITYGGRPPSYVDRKG